MTVGPVQSSGTTLRPEIGLLLEPWDQRAAQYGYVADVVAPYYDVAEATGIYPKLLLEEMLREVQTRRAQGSGYERVTISHGSQTYETEEHGLEVELDDRAQAANSRLYNAETVAAKYLRDAIMRAREVRVAEYFAAETWGGTTSSTVDWTSTSADPFENNRDAIAAVRDQCGLPANTIVITWDVFNALRDNDALVDRIKSDGQHNPTRGIGDVTENPNASGMFARAVAEQFGVDRIVIAGGIRNSANIGQTASLSDIWSDDNIYYMRVPEGDPFENAAPVVTFHWDGDGSSHEGMFEQYRDEIKRADILRMRHDEVIQTLNANAVYKLTGVTSA